MAWTLETGVNDGYPHNANTRYGNPGLVTPYPDGMWRIQSGVNDGYPYRSSFLQPETGLCLVYLGTKQPLKLYNGAESVLAAYFGSVEVFRTGTT
ncbi:hypothetical protein [Ruminococcus champanellensis]|uniref:hypothetical protein n=1 Tax=Ruminococcus champanellensis TaxID=1161942 RepID=UPI0039F524A2